MTTIAASKRHSMMSGDTHASDGSSSFNTRKVFYVDNMAIGVAGEAQDIDMFVRWVKNPEVVPELSSDFSALVLTKQKRLYLYEHKLSPTIIMDDFYAIGSGSQVANYIMLIKGTTDEAVRAAMKVDDATKGKVHTIKL